MKRILITTTLVSLFAAGIASADINTDLNTDLVYGPSVNSEVNFSRMPATGAGRSTTIKTAQNYGGMQDHPSERASGI
ncbi:hypothetical protein [Sedimenticola hydrogenitrophicus]|uniref:hypothetical protein n=1 Tax=Sedimenticola hydrogenitrophicus TaxID=2967975 RepID=UPI0021A65BD5|nr:hypothetical protein [Sedimenticola hydrogenitrophicus]